MNNKINEKTMRATYKVVFGREFDDPKRRQHPLPIEIAYAVALHGINKKLATIRKNHARIVK